MPWRNACESSGSVSRSARSGSTGVGLTIGTAVGIGLGSLMSGILFGVESNDPLTMTLAIGAIGLTAILASLAPLRHAVRVSPAEILRAE